MLQKLGQFHMGIPEYRALSPCSVLYSRLVIIRQCIEPQIFLKAAQRRLESKSIDE